MTRERKSISEQTLFEIVNTIKSGLLADKLHHLADRGEIPMPGHPHPYPDHPNLTKSVFEDEEYIRQVRSIIGQARRDLRRQEAAYDEFERRLQAYHQDKRKA